MDDSTKVDLYKEIYQTIHEYVRKLTPDSEQQKEVTQTVLVKIYESIDALRDHQKLTAWLQRIVYTTVVDYYRQRKQERKVVPLLPDTNEETINEGNVAVMECIALLINLLPPEQREVLDAVELQGISQTQYAKAHSLPVSTVKSRLQRAKQKIRTQIKNSCFLTTDAYGNIVDFVRPVKEI